jgi:uridylate kinase
MKIVLKLGGHNLTEKLTSETLTPYLNVIKTLAKQGHRIATVTGGGRIAREYIGVARKFRADESFSDELGIDVARLNAKLLIAGLADIAWQRVPITLEEVAVGFQSGKIIVMGGLTPGQSTSAVSALVAERIGADLLLIATNVDGVYSSDPRKNRKAEKLDKVGTRALHRIIREGGARAGEYELLDLVTLSILERSKVKTIILNGSNPQNILKAVNGGKIGTIVN